MRRLLALAPLLAAACASAQWEKDGADSAAVDQDIKACTQQARLKATGTMALPPLPTPGMIGAPLRGQDQAALREAEEFHACMQAKGYKEKR